MTRETKIGLLVGLAFIIVIGILLSDHFSSSNEPPRAELARAGDNVRRGVGMPGQAGPPPITIVPPVEVKPTGPVLTNDDLKPRPQQPVDQPVVLAHRQPINPQPVGPRNPNPGPVGIDPLLRQVAQQHGEEIVKLNSNDPFANPEPTPLQSNPVKPDAVRLVSSNQAREYKAQEGDSVSRMASRFLGANTKASRAAIIKANPALQADPNRVIVGRTYIIPAKMDAGGTIPPAAPVVERNTPIVNKPTDNSTDREHWYTVKENESLWQIARDQLGTGTAYIAIAELNKDLLNGDVKVKVGQRLRLPAKPITLAS